MSLQGSQPARLQALRAQLPYLPQALQLVWTAARGWTTVWTLLLLVQGVLPVATVYLTKAVVDNLVGALAGSATWEAIRPTLLLVESGKIVESGSHEALLQANGRYAQSWRQQMRRNGAVARKERTER